MNILSNPFSLPTAFDERAVRAAIKKANLGLVQFGKNAQLSPEAINRFAASVNEVVRRSIIAGAGVASLPVRPTASGLILTIPIQYLNLLGQPTLFSYASTPLGNPDIAFTHDFTASADGQYAIVVEWCEAPAIPSSTNGLPPTAIAGQNNNNNKIDNSTFYTAGNLTRTNASDGTADAALRLNTSVQAIRATQVQYNTRVITDATLVGLASTLGTGTFAAAPSDEPNLVRLDLPSDYLSATPRTTNGYIYAAKLCVIVKNASTLTIYTGDNIPIGLVATQRPMPVAPTRDVLQSQINTAASDATAANAAIAAHISNPADAHDASAVSTTAIAGVAGGVASNTQAVLAGLRTQIASLENVNAGPRLTALEVAKKAQTFILSVVDNPSATAGTNYGDSTNSTTALGNFLVPTDFQGKRVMVSVGVFNNKNPEDGTHNLYVRYSGTSAPYPNNAFFLVGSVIVPSDVDPNYALGGTGILTLPSSAVNLHLDLTCTNPLGLGDSDAQSISITLLEI